MKMHKGDVLLLQNLAVMLKCCFFAKLYLFFRFFFLFVIKIVFIFVKNSFGKGIALVAWLNKDNNNIALVVNAFSMTNK